jgi:single-strand DNA-binding protein
MASYNRVILMGNLTRDPELRYIPSGTAVSDISLAVNERIKRNEQWIDEVHFFDVTVWGREAEIANEYLSKGSPVLIEGRLRQDRWEKDGQKHSKIKVVCDKLRLVGSKGDRGGSPGEGGGRGRASRGGAGGGDSYRDEPQYDEADQFSRAGGPPPDDDIPF